VTTLRTDVTPMRVAAFQRVRKRPWPVLVDVLNRRLKDYGGRACHDGTGMGDVIDAQVEGEATPILMVGKARQDLLTEYIAAVERGEIVGPFIRSAEQEHRWATQDILYGEHPPDTLVAGAMAYRAAKLAAIGGSWRRNVGDFTAGAVEAWRIGE
jgi:hypothetical protein